MHALCWFCNFITVHRAQKYIICCRFNCLIFQSFSFQKMEFNFQYGINLKLLKEVHDLQYVALAFCRRDAFVRKKPLHLKQCFLEWCYKYDYDIFWALFMIRLAVCVKISWCQKIMINCYEWVNFFSHGFHFISLKITSPFNKWFFHDRNIFEIIIEKPQLI